MELLSLAMRLNMVGMRGTRKATMEIPMPGKGTQMLHSKDMMHHSMEFRISTEVKEIMLTMKDVLLLTIQQQHQHLLQNVRD